MSLYNIHIYSQLPEVEIIYIYIEISILFSTISLCILARFFFSFTILLFFDSLSWIGFVMVGVESHLAGLSLEGFKEKEVCKIDNNESVMDNSLDSCFVGSSLTLSVVHFQSMRATLANVWHLIGGISIIDLSMGRFLFRLFHMDVDHIEAGDP